MKLRKLNPGAGLESHAVACFVAVGQCLRGGSAGKRAGNHVTGHAGVGGAPVFKRNHGSALQIHRGPGQIVSQGLVVGESAGGDIVGSDAAGHDREIRDIGIALKHHKVIGAAAVAQGLVPAGQLTQGGGSAAGTGGERSIQELIRRGGSVWSVGNAGQQRGGIRDVAAAGIHSKMNEVALLHGQTVAFQQGAGAAGAEIAGGQRGFAAQLHKPGNPGIRARTAGDSILELGGEGNGAGPGGLPSNGDEPGGSRMRQQHAGPGAVAIAINDQRIGQFRALITPHGGQEQSIGGRLERSPAGFIIAAGGWKGDLDLLRQERIVAIAPKIVFTGPLAPPGPDPTAGWIFPGGEVGGSIIDRLGSAQREHLAHHREQGQNPGPASFMGED